MIKSKLYLPILSQLHFKLNYECKKVVMVDNALRYFLVGSNLSNLILSQTNDGKFLRRNFVRPLIKFCQDGNYTAKIGIVYGLRSTGKTVGMLQAAEELTLFGHKVMKQNICLTRKSLEASESMTVLR